MMTLTVQQSGSWDSVSSAGVALFFTCFEVVIYWGMGTSKVSKGEDQIIKRGGVKEVLPFCT